VPTLQDEKGMRSRYHDVNRIDFLNLASKITDSRPANVGTRASRNNKGTTGGEQSAKSNGVGSLKKVGSINGSQKNGGNTSSSKVKEPESAATPGGGYGNMSNSNVRKSSRIKS